MTIYLDGLFILNFFFDFILLLSVSIILKRNIKIKYLLLGSLLGSLSIFMLFLSINKYELIIYKIIISILMIITSFGFKNIKYTLKNIIYLYLISIVLGGFLYMINNSFDYHNGLVFYSDGISINVIFIIIMTPILIFINIRNISKLKQYKLYYKVSIYLDNNKIDAIGYLDTGNKLVSLYSGRPVILLRNKSPVFNNLKYSLIPYNTIDNNGYIKCYKPDKVYIEGIGEYTKVVIGLINNDISMDGVDCILNSKLLEDI